MAGEAPPARSGLRSAGAVLGGLIVIVVLSIGTDSVLHATGVFPPWGKPMSDPLFVVATIYRFVYGVFGSYVTARLAPGRPMSHALLLGLIGVMVSLAGALATWNAGPEFGPAWYSLILVVMALPCGWLGGLLFTRR